VLPSVISVLPIKLSALPTNNPSSNGKFLTLIKTKSRKRSKHMIIKIAKVNNPDFRDLKDFKNMCLVYGQILSDLFA
jgi:hypothetical protein